MIDILGAALMNELRSKPQSRPPREVPQSDAADRVRLFIGLLAVLAIPVLALGEARPNALTDRAALAPRTPPDRG